MPLYKDVADKIIQFIKTNNMKVGERMPSINEFCNILSSGRHSVQNAFEELCYTGVLESKAKSGYFISDIGWRMIFPKKVDWHKYKSKGFLSERCKGSGVFQETSGVSLSRFAIGSHFGNAKVFEESIKHLSKQGNIFDSRDTDYRGMFRLRKLLCDFMSDYGNIKASPDEILITSGVFNSLSLIKLALLRSTDCFFIDNCITPKDDSSYSSFGLNKINLPIDSQGIIIDNLISQIKNNKHSILCSVFGAINPYADKVNDGFMGDIRKAKILRACNTANIPIIEIDNYRGIAPDKVSPPLKSFDDSESVIYLNSFTKVFMNNFRLGWLVAPADVIVKLANIKLMLAGNQNLISQLVAVDMLESGNYYKYLKSLRSLLDENRTQALKILDKYLYSLATWNIYGNRSHIFIKFAPEISVRKMYENRFSYVQFTPWYLMDKEYEQTIGICITKMTLDNFEKYIILLASLARRSIE